jgi:hypothetical protein
MIKAIQLKCLYGKTKNLTESLWFVRGKLFIIFMIGFFLGLCLAPSTVGGESFNNSAETELTKERIKRLAAEFRSLRRIPGHFTDSTWNKDVDQWMGRKHKVMLELGSHLAHGDYHKRDLSNLLDPPDQISREGDRLFPLIASVPGSATSTGGSNEYLVYYWRGVHDFLFFICRGGVITGSGWFYSGD